LSFSSAQGQHECRPDYWPDHLHTHTLFFYVPFI
jgi:hypothetical protein